MNILVNFEIASFLKAKGFEWETTSYYDGSGELFQYSYSNNTMQRFRCSAPTIAEVVMWLYEKHGIWIVAFPELLNGETIRFYPCIFEQGVGEDIEKYFNSPTEAYEAAINYTLKELI